jgi:hypothetical protein
VRKNNINEDLFLDKNKITKESSYILGLIWADGTIGKNNYSCSVTGVSEDFDSLVNIFNSTGNWAVYIRKAKGIRKQQTTYYYSSKSFHEFLLKNKYKEKSLTSALDILNHIPQKYHSYWWLGFFDGDGCIYIKKNNQLFFTGSLLQDWSFFNLLPLKIKWKHILKQTKNGSYSRMLTQSKNDIITFCDYIYKNIEVDQIGFQRKYEKFKYLKTPKERKVIKLGGVYFNKKIKRWIARITYNKIQYALGCFLEKEDAINAVIKKRKKLTEEFEKNIDL